MGCGRARREASLRHCGRNLDVSGWGAERLGGSQPTDQGSDKGGVVQMVSVDTQRNA